MKDYSSLNIYGGKKIYSEFFINKH